MMQRLNDINLALECNFATVLSYANSSNGIATAMRLNKNINPGLYPLTENSLKNYYYSSDYSNLKKTFKDANCAADAYSYFLQSYGLTNYHGTSGASGASGANSSGLNPFGLFDLDLGFNLGKFSWLWLVLVGAIAYKVLK
jgi:hypothetical protein